MNTNYIFKSMLVDNDKVVEVREYDYVFDNYIEAKTILDVLIKEVMQSISDCFYDAEKQVIYFNEDKTTCEIFYITSDLNYYINEKDMLCEKMSVSKNVKGYRNNWHIF